MAAKGNYKLAALSAAVNDAYFHIERVISSKQGCSAEASVYENKETSDNRGVALSSFSFGFPYIAGLDPLEAANLKLPHVSGMPNLTPVLEPGQSPRETPPEFLPPVEEPAAPAEA